MTRRLTLKTPDGDHLAELPASAIGPIRWELNTPTTADVDLSGADPRTALLRGDRYLELALWRDEELLLEGPVIGRQEDELGNLSTVVAHPAWHLTGRPIGRPRRNLVDNPGFTSGFAGWQFLAPTGYLDLKTTTEAGLTMALSGTPRFSALAPAANCRLVNQSTDPTEWPMLVQEIDVDGGPFGAVVTAVAYHYWRFDTVSLIFAAGDHEPDRGLRLQRFPRDWRSIDYGGGGPLGWRNLYFASVALGPPEQTSDLSEVEAGTPPRLWVRHEVSVYVPPGAEETVLLRLEGPQRGGSSYWTGPRVVVDEALEYLDDDPVDIVADLIGHAQDDDLGYTSLRLDAAGDPSDVTIDRRYPFADRTTVAQALDDLAEEGIVDYGYEVAAAAGATERTIVAYVPRRDDVGPILETGRNVATWEWVAPDADAASAVIMQSGDTTSAARAEGYAEDLDGFADGLTRTTVATAPEGTPEVELDDAAATELAAASDPITITLSSTLTPPGLALSDVRPGQSVRLHLSKPGHALRYWGRVVAVTLDPSERVDLEVVLGVPIE